MENYSRFSYLTDDLKQFMNIIMQKNGYFGHLETIITAVFVDSNQNVWGVALHRILKARGKTRAGLRVFQISAINFTAKSYVDLTDYQNVWRNLLFHSLVERTYNATDKVWRMSDIIHTMSECPVLANFPRHTQCVKRELKLTTKTSFPIIRENNCEGYVWSKMESRRFIYYHL